jgi:hypothetical protein
MTNCSVPLYPEIEYEPNGIPASEVLCRVEAWGRYVGGWYDCQQQGTCEEQQACNLFKYLEYVQAVTACATSNDG